YRISRLCALIVALLAAAQLGSALPQSSKSVATKSAHEVSPLQPAQQLIQQDQLEQATQIVQAQLRSNPDSAEAYNLLGIIYTSEKRYAEANDAFQQALKIAPDSKTTHNNLGNLYVAEQKLDLAEKEFRSVLQSSPSNRDANYNLGLLLLAK